MKNKEGNLFPGLVEDTEVKLTKQNLGTRPRSTKSSRDFTGDFMYKQNVD